MLFNQCRSGPSHRVRIVLTLKCVEYQYIAIDIRAGKQREDAYLAINPQGLVPALKADGRILTQSGPIIEWLEETYPEPALLPDNPWERAMVRSMASVIGSDTQPLNNLRVRSHLRDRLHIDSRDIEEWAFRWIAEAFDALEHMVAQFGDGFCFGDSPTLADVYLVPQVAMSGRLGFDMTPYPRLTEVATVAGQHPAFHAARPEAQPDWS